MLTWRFAVHLNLSLVELVGLVIEKTEVAHLKSFPCIVVKKTSQVTCGDQISVLSGVVVPIVDVDRCLAMVKVGLSRFQKPKGNWQACITDSAQDVRKIHISWFQ